MIIVLLILEKDKYNVNRISRRLIGSTNFKFNGGLVFPIDSTKRTVSKFGSHIVFLCSETGDSWIVCVIYTHFMIWVSNQNVIVGSD